MDWNRREFIVTSSLAVTAGALRPPRLFGQQAPATPPPPVVPVFETLRRNVGTFTARGGTIGWYVASDAVLVIDSQFPDSAKMFLDGLKSRTTRRIDLLIITGRRTPAATSPSCSSGRTSCTGPDGARLPAA